MLRMHLEVAKERICFIRSKKMPAVRSRLYVYGYELQKKQ